MNAPNAEFKWYEKQVLPAGELERLIQEEGFNKHMGKISPYNNPNQSKYVKLGDKLAVLRNNGIVGYYTITAMKDKSGFHVVGRDETGTSKKGMEFCLDSSMCWCFDVGYKVISKFPWESISTCAR